jgi:hypothetical protein
MTCGQIKDRLGPYLDDEVPPEMRSAVEAHLCGCQECSRELESLRDLVSAVAATDAAPVPTELWNAIEGRLVKAARRRHAVVLTFRRAVAVAAVLAVAVGLGLLALPGGLDGARNARAAVVDFGVLLDGLKMDPDSAFDAFLAQYHPKEVSAAEAKAYAPGLTFELPDTLPGGFQRCAVYELCFGDKHGVAARYMRNGELLGLVFHPPILQMRFGGRENRSCEVGKIHGQTVDVGPWTLSHLTDPTTCHCVLTKLNKANELQAVMAAIAPNSGIFPAPTAHQHP